jgi:ribose transport system permease protein
MTATAPPPVDERTPLGERLGRVRVASWATAGLLVAAVVIAVVLQPGITTPYGIASTFATFLPLVLVAVAQAVVVIGGGLDLSAGAIVALSSVVAVQVMQGSDQLALVGFAAAIGTGLACGLVNGLIVSRLRLQPLIATFATASVFSGLALLVLPTPGGTVPAVLTGTFRQAVAMVPVSLLLVVAVALGWLVVRRLRIMRHIRATGGGPAAAFASLVPVAGAQLASYAICGGVCGIAAMAVLGNAGSGDPFIGGDLALNSIAAVVIGGIALRGGIGSPIGAIAGAITLSLASTILFSIGLPTSWRALASGLVVILALALSALGAPRRQR